MKNQLKTCGIYFVDKFGLLLICKATNGGWSIPKGLVDSTDEGDLATAVRELKEETNIDIYEDFDSIQMIKDLPKSTYKTRKKILISYLIKTKMSNDNFNLKCNSFFGKSAVQLPEISEYKWVTISEAKDYLHESQLNNLDMIKIHLKFTE